MNTLGKPQLAAHLTDDQFAACMTGTEADASVAAHLAICESCRAEVASFKGAVDSFSSAALTWSESRPSLSLRAKAAKVRSQPMFAMASWVFAACLLLLTVVPAAHRLGLYRAPAEESVVQVDSPTQIEQDNQLLMAVNREIALEPRSPALEYGIAVPLQGRMAHTPGARSE